MSAGDFTNPPSGPESNQPSTAEPGWGAPQPNYSQTGYPPPPPPPPGYTQTGYPPQPGYRPSTAGEPLSDVSASILAYMTIIPAIIFLVLAPYNEKPVVKFHAIQELGLALIGLCLQIIAFVPLLGTLVWMVGGLALIAVWVLCVVKASQGSALKLPVIGDFAAQHSGYRI